MLAFLPHRAEDCVIVLAPVLMAVLLFAVPFLSNRGERSWRRRPWAPVLVIFIGTCLAVLWLEGERESWTPDFAAKPLPDSIVGAGAVVTKSLPPRAVAMGVPARVVRLRE